MIEFGHVQQKPSTPTMSGLKKSKKEERKEGMKKERKKKERKKEFPLSVKQPYGGDRGSNFRIFSRCSVSYTLKKCKNKKKHGHIAGSCVRGQTMKTFSNPFLLVSCFPGMLLRYCVSNSETVPFVPLITGISFAFTFHVRCISIIRFLYFKIF